MICGSTNDNVGAGFTTVVSASNMVYLGSSTILTPQILQTSGVSLSVTTIVSINLSSFQ